MLQSIEGEEDTPYGGMKRRRNKEKGRMIFYERTESGRDRRWIYRGRAY